MSIFTGKPDPVAKFCPFMGAIPTPGKLTGQIVMQTIPCAKEKCELWVLETPEKGYCGVKSK